MHLEGVWVQPLRNESIVVIKAFKLRKAPLINAQPPRNPKHCQHCFLITSMLTIDYYCLIFCLLMYSERSPIEIQAHLNIIKFKYGHILDFLAVAISCYDQRHSQK